MLPPPPRSTLFPYTTLFRSENLIGEASGGFKAFMKTLTGGRISIGALALGLAQGAYEHSVRFSKERKQFNQPIANFQDRKSTRLNSSHVEISYAVFCLKKKK